MSVGYVKFARCVFGLGLRVCAWLLVAHVVGSVVVSELVIAPMLAEQAAIGNAGALPASGTEVPTDTITPPLSPEDA